VEAALAAVTSFARAATSSTPGWGYLPVPPPVMHVPLGEQGLGEQTPAVRYGVSGD